MLHVFYTLVYNFNDYIYIYTYAITHEYKHWLGIVKHSLTCAHVSLLICGDTLQHIWTLTHSITHTVSHSPLFTTTHPYPPPFTLTYLSLGSHSSFTNYTPTTHSPFTRAHFSPTTSRSCTHCSSLQSHRYLTRESFPSRRYLTK